jgi:hypothetical protein
MSQLKPQPCGERNRKPTAQPSAVDQSRPTSPQPGLLAVAAAGARQELVTQVHVRDRGSGVLINVALKSVAVVGSIACGLRGEPARPHVRRHDGRAR